MQGKSYPKFKANIFEYRFLLASLHIKAILRGTTIARRKKALESIKDGGGLGDAYGATLERIKAQDEEKTKLAMATLTWVCHSERPLQVDELCHALAVDIGATDFDPENIPSIGTLLHCCQGLIMVDKEASTVRLIHYTVQEYLCSHPSLFNKPHSILAETCLTYLKSQQVKNLESHSPSDNQIVPFLKYSSRYWGTHARREQCSQSSGAPVGPGGGTAKTPGRDGTAKCSPSSSLNPQDGRHWQGRQAPRSETTWDRGRKGTVGDGRGRQGTVGDGRGRQVTAGDGRGVFRLPERVGDGWGLWGTAGDGR